MAHNIQKRLLGNPVALIVMATILFLSITLISDRLLRGASLDLTEDALYTLSDGTVQVLRELREPVQLDYYISRDLVTPYPGLLAYSKRVEDMLRAMKAAVPEAIDLSIVEPEPFTEAEDNAVAAGLQGIPLNDGTTLYMGLTARNLLDGEGAIPFFSDERGAFLEYDIVKMILSLDQTTRPTLGLITSLPMQFGAGGPQAMIQGQSQPFVIYQQLQDFFDVRDLGDDFDTLEGVDLLLIVHPSPLADDQLFLLDQYALAGGRMAIFLDPHVESLNPQAQFPVSSNLGPLLTAWGAKVTTEQVVADLDYAQRVQMGGYGANSVKSYPLWLAINEAGISRNDIAVGALNSVNLATPGAVSLSDDSSLTLSPLVQSSAMAALFPASRALGAPDPDGLIRDLEPTGERYTLVARVAGEAKTAFPDRVADGVGLQNGQVRMVLGGDADLFYDRFWVRVQAFLGQQLAEPIAGNGGMILNMLDNLSGSDALLSLRTRGVANRPFEVVDRIRRTANDRYLAEEQALSEALAQTEARLAELEAGRGNTGALYSQEQEAEIERFRNEMVNTRRQLRDVQGSLRRDIDRLGDQLAFVNIALVPLLILLSLLVTARLRRARKAQH